MRCRDAKRRLPGTVLQDHATCAVGRPARPCFRVPCVHGSPADRARLPAEVADSYTELPCRSVLPEKSVRQPRAVPVNIDEYVAAFSGTVAELLQSIRQTVREAAPGAVEKISYGIPAFVLRGNLIHFAAFKNHIGIYPGPSAINAFKQDLWGYRTTKGTIQLPLDQPLPLALIEKLVKFRIEENSGLAKGKDLG
jgi:uncharacterized protein YdhG (YjbR/CyaY superfamily)